jgi:hypothetical protein
MGHRSRDSPGRARHVLGTSGEGVPGRPGTAAASPARPARPAAPDARSPTQAPYPCAQRRLLDVPALARMANDAGLHLVRRTGAPLACYALLRPCPRATLTS